MTLVEDQSPLLCLEKVFVRNRAFPKNRQIIPKHKQYFVPFGGGHFTEKGPFLESTRWATEDACRGWEGEVTQIQTGRRL